MRQIQMVEIQSLEVDFSWKCKYCGSSVPKDNERVDVIDPRTHRILYVYCQKHKCMQAHLKEFYKGKLDSNHICYENGCTEREY